METNSPARRTEVVAAADSSQCCFNDCRRPVAHGKFKCEYHRKKNVCCVDDCTNQVYARRLCVGHGARNPCQFPGCAGFARSKDMCSRHKSQRRTVLVKKTPRPTSLAKAKPWAYGLLGASKTNEDIMFADVTLPFNSLNVDIIDEILETLLPMPLFCFERDLVVFH